MSRVLQYNKKITLEKLGSQQTHDAEDQEYQEVKELYRNFLESSNVTDFMDVFARLKEECGTNEQLQKQLTSSSFVVLNPPRGTVEVKTKTMLKLTVFYDASSGHNY